MWLAITVLVLGGCADLCSGDRSSDVTFAAMASYGDEITACIRGQGCDRLCSDAFHLDAEIESCAIISVVPQDGAAQPGPVAPSIDPQSLSGANVRITYVEHVTCDQGMDIAAGDGTTDDGSDNGSCDDGSCDDGSPDGSCDDGSCDDGSGDDGPGDDGSGDDGSGDDGSGVVAPGPTPASAAGRARAAPSADRAASAASGIADRATGGISRGRGPGRR